MNASKAGEAVGIGLAAALNVSTKLAVIAACGRYLGWW